MLLWLIPLATASAQTPQETMDSLRRAYIRHYKDIAMDEMERSGIPASIKLAQGILESRAGTSELALKASNHFGIKCGKDWKGKTYYKHDDERDRKGQPRASCFRHYRNVVECFADHSAFIRNPEKNYRYGFLFELDPLDYQAWAQGLQKAGYSSVDYYAEKLIFYIEWHRLFEFDQQVYNGRVAPKRLVQVNGVQMVQARAGETLRDIARLYNVPVEHLIAHNDDFYGPDDEPGMGAWVYVQPKPEQWNGTEEFHLVASGQSLYDIAQRFAIRLESLRQRNGLKPGEEPAEYEYIRLRGKRKTGEKVRLRSPGQSNETTTLTVREARPAGSRIIVEKLSETPLENPIPMDSMRADLVEDRPESLLEQPPESPRPDATTPLIVVNMQTGETEIYHTVSKGETLYSIARRYGVSAAEIKKWNRMRDDVIRAGQSLRVN